MRRRASDAPLMRPPQRRRRSGRAAQTPLNVEDVGTCCYGTSFWDPLSHPFMTTSGSRICAAPRKWGVRALNSLSNPDVTPRPPPSRASWRRLQAPGRVRSPPGTFGRHARGRRAAAHPEAATSASRPAGRAARRIEGTDRRAGRRGGGAASQVRVLRGRCAGGARAVRGSRAGVAVGSFEGLIVQVNSISINGSGLERVSGLR